jgi:hypothetical protein
MGSLHKNISATYLVGLYQQQFESVKQLCPLEIRMTEEVVHPLQNNWFLAYSPEVQTDPIHCRNGTQGEVYITVGVNKFFISPGCKCILNDHIITTDLNVQLDTDIIHYEWSLDRLSLDDLDLTSLTSNLTMMEAPGLKLSTLQDLQTLRLEVCRSHRWLPHYIYTTGMEIVTLMILSVISYGSYMCHLYYL